MAYVSLGVAAALIGVQLILFGHTLRHAQPAVKAECGRDAIQVYGGYGFVKELAATGEFFPLEAIYRDCKIGEIYEGANEIQRMLIARSIFGKDAVGLSSDHAIGSGSATSYCISSTVIRHTCVRT